MERKSPEEMYGEAFREAGILVIVFGLLDAFFDTSEHGPLATLGVVTFTAIVMFLGNALLFAGVMLERRRQR